MFWWIVAGAFVAAAVVIGVIWFKKNMERFGG